jgi:hypothetical protein
MLTEDQVTTSWRRYRYRKRSDLALQYFVQHQAAWRARKLDFEFHGFPDKKSQAQRRGTVEEVYRGFELPISGNGAKIVVGR